ncbi:MAG: DNA-3-methyladenine glycosylase I [Selenomonadaceae bacterium]|nr:DNA-3-methyladenine glycosylase I [Selenomonadaceae bacterium]
MRCSWCGDDPLLIQYHDEEFGIPTTDDRKHFEALMLESLQCGLNWKLILRKREIFRKCFDEFDFEKIARYDDSDVARIFNTEGMIRSERKIRAIINNAQKFIEIRNEFGSFHEFVENQDQLTRELKHRGFKFLGESSVTSYLQAVGILNGHEEGCSKFAQ